MLNQTFQCNKSFETKTKLHPSVQKIKAYIELKVCGCLVCRFEWNTYEHMASEINTDIRCVKENFSQRRITESEM